MEEPTTPSLPRRVAHAGIGDGPKHLALTHTASAEVIEMFLAALVLWDPTYHVEIEPAPGEDASMLWQLWAWN